MPIDPRSSLGYQKLSCGTATGGTTLTVPDGANGAYMIPEGTVWWRDDPSGTALASGDGIPLLPYVALDYSRGNLSAFRAMSGQAAAVNLHITYYE